MPIVSGGPQQSYAGKVEEPAKPRRLRRPGLGAGAEPERPRRIGVVFVHGIGSQRPGETLLDWSRPIIKALTEWIAAHRATPDAGDREHIDPSTARDPVDTSHVDFSGSQLPIIEIDVPATTAD